MNALYMMSQAGFALATIIDSIKENTQIKHDVKMYLLDKLDTAYLDIQTDIIDVISNGVGSVIGEEQDGL